MSNATTGSAIDIAADGYPIVHFPPRIVHEYNRCSYPLHPTNNYQGEKSHRSQILLSGQTLAPETPMIIVPHWQEFEAGEWRWCPRCTRRNTIRLATVKKMYEASLTVKSHVKVGLLRHPKLHDWGRGWARLGGRFVTPRAQTIFANQHAPADMFWCAWAYHYAPLDDLAMRRGATGKRWCVYCHKRWGKFQHLQRFRQHKAQGQKDYQAFRALLAQITAAKRELADLRRLKEAVAQEIVAMQSQAGSRSVNENETETPYDILLSGEAMTGPLHSPEQRAPRGPGGGGSRRDRRMARST